MEQAFFLVTSLAGLKKLTFQQKIKALLEEHVQITALLAIVQFDEYEIARQTLQAMVKPEQAAQFEIRTMAELVPIRQGLLCGQKTNLMMILKPYQANSCDPNNRKWHDSPLH